MTIRLTDAQMTVLRALDKLPGDGSQWVYPTRRTFSSGAALALCFDSRIAGRPKLLEASVGRSPRAYRLLPSGRDFIANLKAEGRW